MDQDDLQALWLSYMQKNPYIRWVKENGEIKPQNGTAHGDQQIQSDSDGTHFLILKNGQRREIILADEVCGVVLREWSTFKPQHKRPFIPYLFRQYAGFSHRDIEFIIAEYKKSKKAAKGKARDMASGNLLPDDEHSERVLGLAPPTENSVPSGATLLSHSLNTNTGLPEAQSDAHYLNFQNSATSQDATTTAPTPTISRSNNYTMAQTPATPATVNDDPMAQHDALLAQDLPNLISHFTNAEGKTVLYEHFEHIKDALRFGRAPAIHIPAGLPHASESVSLEACDLIVADETHASRILQGPREALYGKVLLIRSSADELPQPDSLAKMVDAFSEIVTANEMLGKEGNPGGIKIDVQDMTQDWGKRNTTSRPLSEVLEQLKDGTPWAPDREPPLNLLNIASGRNISIEPQFLTTYGVFGIINKITRLYQIKKGGTLGKAIPFEFEACRNFQIFGQKLTSSLWHKDSMGFGTWVRCMFGKKVWPVMANMTEDDWKGFTTLGTTWKPRDQSVPLIVLHPGDVLVMLPGNHNVHAPITLEDCHMAGGMFWDTRCMGKILEHIKAQLEYDSISNEDVPASLKDILSYLRILVTMYPWNFAVEDGDAAELIDQIDEVLATKSKKRKRARRN
ncbi:hypothetical protein HYFRA_00004192 [Hymenoscyphus fraxineus]|uniref:JmjC domain-containing protein n=1 Tax=Hymenoscyphus fraxineus TaxID=746836 RepID=A0A9N9PF31_9HELO|nr:hypothetical protein HYFRA_00004192 [Hymenoscyphus fraxineus]